MRHRRLLMMCADDNGMHASMHYLSFAPLLAGTCVLVDVSRRMSAFRGDHWRCCWAQNTLSNLIQHRNAAPIPECRVSQGTDSAATKDLQAFLPDQAQVPLPHLISFCSTSDGTGGHAMQVLDVESLDRCQV